MGKNSRTLEYTKTRAGRWAATRASPPNSLKLFMINENYIKKILIITLSNIGDVLLTLPAILCMEKIFPLAMIHIMTSERAAACIPSTEHIHQIIIHKKNSTWQESLSLIHTLRKNNYDLIIDFRNTLIPWLVPAQWHTPVLRRAPKQILPMAERHLWKIKSLGIDIHNTKIYYPLSPQEKAQGKELLQGFRDLQKKLVAFAPGARSDIKRWPKEHYRTLIQKITTESPVQVVLLGDQHDHLLMNQEITLPKPPLCLDLTGKTSWAQIASLLQESCVLVSNDSALMHMGWLVGTPTIALFGPTDPKKYAPTGTIHTTLHVALSCSPCEKAQCHYGHHDCMQQLDIQEVYHAIKEKLHLS